ncbi:MAG: acetate--CoA ligase family protein [Anaerolineaceae bacterium]|nr:acetate--CoA ligase family protein [Anaerolineaceae bacterium]
MDILKTLDGLFQPKSIAVIGASNTEGKIGYSVMKNLVVDSKYAGPVYPINPKDKEVLGKKAYASILDVPGDVEAAVIVVPSKFALQVTKECGEKGVKGLIVIASGFSEMGKQQLELDMVNMAHQYGVRVLGPNIVGVLSNANHMNASFAPCLPLPGGAALVSQSGALLIAMDTATYTRRVGFDKLISIGNMSDVDFGDCVSWLDADKDTSAISLYIEGNKNGRKFMKAAQKAKKPIIALKAGISAHGAAAAASHTGSLAGAAKVYNAAFQQGGVVQASDLNNLFDRTLALTLQPPLKGDNLLIITNGGGVGVLATDAAERFGIPLAFAPEDVQVELKKHMPEFGSAKNPVDVTGMAGTEWYVKSCGYAITHPWVDGLVVLYCETAVTDPMDIAKGVKKAIDQAGIKDKPLTISFVGGERSDAAIRWLVENGVPAYDAPDTAINAMAALREFAKIKEDVAAATEYVDSGNREAALKIIEGARADGRDSLTEVEAKLVFKIYGMPVTQNLLATSEDEAVKLANQIGYPIVMKIVSPDILHKSDAGGVKVNIKDDAGIREAYRTIISNAKAYRADADIHGVVIQEMAPWGTEVIIGSVNDPTFGPTIMFGLGGIFVEVLKDVTFRVAPVSTRQAEKMITEINGAPILDGVRGEAPRDREVLLDTIMKYSQMVFELADQISETDANPLLVYEEGKGLKVVDARVILKKK